MRIASAGVSQGGPWRSTMTSTRLPSASRIAATLATARATPPTLMAVMPRDSRLSATAGVPAWE
jgi:hypothetical protein